MVPLSFNKSRRMPPWTLAVANLALLLLIVFVGFLSVSRTDASRSDMLVASIQRALGVQGAAAPQPLGEAVDDPIGFPQKIALLHQITPLVDRRQADVETTKEGFFMRMELDTVFVPGTLLLRPEIRHRLRSMATLLASLENLIHVTGYVDGLAAAPAGKKEGDKTAQTPGGHARTVGHLAMATHLQQVPAAPQAAEVAGKSISVLPESTAVTSDKGNDKSQAQSLLAGNPALAHAVAIAEFLVAEGSIPAWRIRTDGKPVTATVSSDNKGSTAAEATASKTTNIGQARRIEIRIARETLSAELNAAKPKADTPAESKPAQTESKPAQAGSKH
ncbi:MAG: hypothetical protein HQM04_06300 [Magnetococcales bacterium]|nr:hypothetical protein [Magnetococcales bacterium]MBF0114638.1 hypothetical protein [Magnetococcales bacterium]